MSKRENVIFGYICAFSTYAVIGYVCYAVYYLRTLMNPDSLHVSLYIFAVPVFLSIWSHIQASFIDPGYIPIKHRRLKAERLPKNVYQYFQKELDRKPFTELWLHDLASVRFPKGDPTDEKSQRKLRLVRQMTKQCFDCECIKPPFTHHCNVCER